MDKITEDHLDKTIEIWQPYYSMKLTRKDAKMIINNFVGLCNFLFQHERDDGYSAKISRDG